MLNLKSRVSSKKTLDDDELTFLFFCWNFFRQKKFWKRNKKNYSRDQPENKKFSRNEQNDKISVHIFLVEIQKCLTDIQTTRSKWLTDYPTTRLADLMAWLPDYLIMIQENAFCMAITWLWVSWVNFNPRNCVTEKAVTSWVTKKSPDSHRFKTLPPLSRELAFFTKTN